MDFSLGNLAAGFFFGVWGVYAVKRAKSEGRFTPLVLGLLLLVFPYFVDTAWIAWVIGGALLAALYVTR